MKIKLLITFCFVLINLLSQMLLTSCSSSDKVVSSGFIQKRKYTKGYFFDIASRKNKTEKKNIDSKGSKAIIEYENENETKDLHDGVLLVNNDTGFTSGIVLIETRPAEPAQKEKKTVQSIITKPLKVFKNENHIKSNENNKGGKKIKIFPWIAAAGILVLVMAAFLFSRLSLFGGFLFGIFFALIFLALYGLILLIRKIIFPGRKKKKNDVQPENENHIKSNENNKGGKKIKIFPWIAAAGILVLVMAASLFSRISLFVGFWFGIFFALIFLALYGLILLIRKIIFPGRKKKKNDVQPENENTNKPEADKNTIDDARKELAETLMIAAIGIIFSIAIVLLVFLLFPGGFVIGG